MKCQVGLQKGLKLRLMDFATADLLSLPFEVHMLIVRELSLKDTCMQVCTVALCICAHKGVRL